MFSLVCTTQQFIATLAEGEIEIILTRALFNQITLSSALIVRKVKRSNSKIQSSIPLIIIETLRQM